MNNFQNIMKNLDSCAERYGGKSKLMEHLQAKKNTFYRAFDQKNGRSLPGGDELCRWLDALRAEVVFPGEEFDDYTMIPKVEAIAGAGASLETNDNVLGMYAFRKDFLRRENISGKNSVMMMVRGDSMEPLLRDGDTILVDQDANEPADGQLFVVRLDDELMVKRLQKTARGWNICSLNSGYAPIHVEGEQENFQVYGRVRWFGRVV